MPSPITASAFFPGPSSGQTKSSHSAAADALQSLDMRGVAAKPASSSGALQAKVSARAAPKINGSTARPTAGEEEAQSSPKTFYNQLPDWSVLLAAITTIFLAAERQWTLTDWKPKRPDMLTDTFGFGKLVDDGLIFRQNFSIRSYEIGADRRASIETLLNHLQETALNHVKGAGLLGDGFGSTPEMTKRGLIWVVNQMHVQADRYPSWGDVVQVDTWVDAAGRNGMRRDWHIRDYNTQQTIMRASSRFAMMNKHTRKLARIPDEVRVEIEPYFMNGAPTILDRDFGLLPKPGEGDAGETFVRTGLKPRWGDLDLNQHVNNVKYIGWILESAPISILEKHELAGMSLDYRRECSRDSVLQSCTTVFTGAAGDSIVCEHVLQLESGATILKGRTFWKPKSARFPEIFVPVTVATS